MFLWGLLLFSYIITKTIGTPLDDYVWAPDEHYSWNYMAGYDVSSKFGDCDYKAYYVNMTSQKWLTDDEFASSSQTKSIWWHELIIIVPDQIMFKNNATLYITGRGRTFIKYNDSDDISGATFLACSTKSVVGVLFQIPNESANFTSDPFHESRGEDGFIGFTWWHFLNDPSQPNWIAFFPMVKAAVRALDTMTAFMNTHLPQLGCQLDYFVVAGGSKRGWVTWLVGAVDPLRVKAIVPIVLDAINFVEFVHKQYQKYGGFSFALDDFIWLNITLRIDEPNMQLLASFMDPYYYRDRLTMPKMVVNAAMDELQCPDDTHNWWDGMPGPKHFLLVPNAEHSMATGIFEALPAVAAFAVSQYLNKETPEITWVRNDTEGTIIATIENNSTIAEVNAWWAYSCGLNGLIPRRDFRLINMDNQNGGPCPCGNILKNGSAGCANTASLWSNQPIQPMIIDGKLTYSISHKDFTPPLLGWVAYFIDFKFENPYKDYAEMGEFNRRLKEKRAQSPMSFIGIPEDVEGYYEFTTEVAIWPPTYPYQPCKGAECGVNMV